MYTIEKFFCTSLPKGVVALGWFTIIYSLITSVVCIVQAELTALICYTILGVGSGVLLILAVHHKSDILLLPWLALNAFQIVIATPIAFFMLLWKHVTEPALLFGALIYLALLTLVIGYGWIGTYSLYRSFKNGEQYKSSSASPRGQV